MAIPLIVTPEFVTKIPSTKQEIKFRPFLVKEEKILFMALEGGDADEIANAVRSVLKNCILNDDVNIEKLSTFDIEFLFLQLRAKSVGEVIELRLKHRESDECRHVTDYGVKVDDIKVQFPRDITDKVMVNDTVGVKLKYPSLESIKLVSKHKDVNLDSVIDLMIEHIEFVFDQDNVYEEFTKQDLRDFIETLNSKQFGELVKFFNDAPELKHEITWTCPECQKEESIVLRGLQSFFI